MSNSEHQSRVLFISPQPFFEWRGSSIRVKFNVMALHQLGYQVDLLTLPIGQDDPAVQCRVIRAWNPFGARKISIGPSALKLWFDFILLLQGIGLVVRNRYDVLHGTEETGFLCYLLSRFCKARCVYEKHSDSGSYSGGLFKSLLLRIYDGVERLTLAKSDLVISTGPGLDEQARSMTKPDLPKEKFRTIADIPSSLVEPDEDQIRAARGEIADDPEQVAVTYVGSFAPYQGIDIIFSAIPMVLGKHPGTRFVIIGGTGDEIRLYREQLAQHGVDKQVRFLGKIDPDRLPAYLAASDILLAPRKSGINSPLKLLDYFKAGAAIVATDTVANKRLLNTDNAALCEFDAEDFSTRIGELIDNPAQRRRLGRNGFEMYKTRYNFAQFKSELDQAYQYLMNPHSDAS